MNSRINKSIEHLENFRFGSSSSQASSGNTDFCRICHESDSTSFPLLTPCMCSGSLRHVHQTCLQQWLTASEMSSCELCKFPFVMTSKTKPFNEWRSLDMSGVERRRLFCAVLFHLAAALCVIWSLCVLIERSADEVRQGKLGWPFWTKLVVVTVGLTGGIVFMYIQCKQYLNLCARWRARNRILLIQNAPEKVAIHHTQSPVQNSHQSSVEPNNVGQIFVSLHRNDSSTLVTSAPLNNNCNALDNNGMMHTGVGAEELTHHQMTSQSQHIVANIENNNSYDDDISCSNISFKHHLRHLDAEGNSLSRGSLHNIYNDNTSISTTNTSATTRNMTSGADTDSNFHRIIPEGPEEEQMSTRENDGSERHRRVRTVGGTSIFIENRDILNDKNYPRLTHHHSQFLLPSAISPRFADAVEMRQKERRRYSDTKLLNSCEFENEFLIDKTKLFGESTRSEDMIFGKCDDSEDFIDKNIQNILEINKNSARREGSSEQNNNAQSQARSNEEA